MSSPLQSPTITKSVSLSEDAAASTTRVRATRATETRYRRTKINEERGSGEDVQQRMASLWARMPDGQDLEAACDAIRQKYNMEYLEFPSSNTYRKHINANGTQNDTSTSSGGPGQSVTDIYSILHPEQALMMDRFVLELTSVSKDDALHAKFRKMTHHFVWMLVKREASVGSDVSTQASALTAPDREASHQNGSADVIRSDDDSEGGEDGPFLTTPDGPEEIAQNIHCIMKRQSRELKHRRERAKSKVKSGTDVGSDGGDNTDRSTPQKVSKKSFDNLKEANDGCDSFTALPSIPVFRSSASASASSSAPLYRNPALAYLSDKSQRRSRITSSRAGRAQVEIDRSQQRIFSPLMQASALAPAPYEDSDDDSSTDDDSDYARAAKYVLRGMKQNSRDLKEVLRQE